MKTLEEIKDEVALNNGYWSYKLAVLAFKDGNMKTKVFNTIVHEISREVAMEALKNASENVNTIVYNEIDEIYEIDKQSILNESNIPKL